MFSGENMKRAEYLYNDSLYNDSLLSHWKSKSENPDGFFSKFPMLVEGTEYLNNKQI